MIYDWSVLRQEECCVITEDEFVRGKSEKIIAAYKVAAEIHKGDVRLTGEPYIRHCLTVAEILSRWEADEDEVIAGLLHDTVEDHPDKISLLKIGIDFGERVVRLVDGVTKIKMYSDKEGDFEALRKIARETFEEPGIAKIKLADRLHNMLTRKTFSREKQISKARETLAVYVPLAESLGMWQVKNALADISFSLIDPERFGVVKKMIDSDPRVDAKFLESSEENFRKILTENKFKATVEHRVGGYWELFEKQKKSGMRADSRPKDYAAITDVVSFRVIIEDEENIGECYRAMGVIRRKYYKLLQQTRSDDYLATPAINGYSALHDTYKLREGNIEVAFTTKEREAFNDWGVASISISELKAEPDKYKKKLIFTPKQELAVVEYSATGIDVAYKLSPLLGLRAVAIKIDGVEKGLETVVPTASLVEILTRQHQRKPKPEWLSFCNRETASQIDSQISMAEHDEEVDKGQKMLVEGVLRERGILSFQDLDEDDVDKVLVELGCWQGINDLYYKVAFGMDLSIIARKLDEMKITKGKYSTVLIEGKNEIGISEAVAELIGKNGADVRNRAEWVDNNENFTIRVLIVVDEKGKRNIEKEVRAKFLKSEVV